MRLDNVGSETIRARLDGLGPRLAWGGLLIGLLGLAASLGLGFACHDGFQRALHAYLVAFAFFLTLSLAALFFVLLQHLVRAGWSVVVRRLAEALAMNLPLLALLSLPILFGLRALYPWADARVLATDAMTAAKQPYLNVPFFLARWLLYFGSWTWLARYLWTRSLRQDEDGDPRWTVQRERTSGPGMVVFALTFQFAFVDLLMSLDPRWYSTIFGVYVFSGAVVAFFALLSILTALLQRSGRLGGAVTDEHYHDLGKLVFAFTVFWAYIAFSQYMLIWYANIPEETTWYLVRQTGEWAAFSLVLLFGHFLLPFGLLLPRFVKRRPKLFGPIAAWVLLMHYLDMYWLVMPGVSPGRIPLHLLDLTCALGIGGLYLAGMAYRLRDCSLIPQKDPRLAESIAFENA